MTANQPPRRRTMPVSREAHLIILLAEASLADCQWDVARARDSSALHGVWDAVEPEVRRHILLFATWAVRDASWDATAGMAERFAAELAAYATRWAAEHPDANAAEFSAGQHRAFILASSLAFDQDDLDVSWEAALTLIARGSALSGSEQ
ncbi:hypothetical protein AB0G73_14200 [Streptomyces sp. NPDC020719]|uniref:hypothetical protein n=1 Tax=Streptomyces sp. NPDC020719 TaxID=3154896 RepID=UPI0033C0B03F